MRRHTILSEIIVLLNLQRKKNTTYINLLTSNFECEKTWAGNFKVLRKVMLCLLMWDVRLEILLDIKDSENVLQFENSRGAGWLNSNQRVVKMRSNSFCWDTTPTAMEDSPSSWFHCYYWPGHQASQCCCGVHRNSIFWLLLPLPPNHQSKVLSGLHFFELLVLNSK